MSFIIGKLKRHVSQKHNEYFVGNIGGIPVRGAWSKKEKGQDDLCVFLDNDKITFLSKENKTAAPEAQVEKKP